MVLKPQPKPRPPWRSEKYRRFVASLPCAVCRRTDVQAHHEQLHGGVMGSKVSDEFCVPLCIKCHVYRHSYGRSFWKLDPEEIIKRTQDEWVRRGGRREWE